MSQEAITKFVEQTGQDEEVAKKYLEDFSGDVEKAIAKCKEVEVDSGDVCDGCGNNFGGPRSACASCEDLELCKNCCGTFTSEDHNSSHTYKDTKKGWSVGATQNSNSRGNFLARK
eukprot:TRINITY_DN16413_c0_g1_i1.p1 TRINITY_DN16413_c0_g1~~TRINITY_DN16413_c0_g1_i1.p1  ORF type:complete len:136 (+),score=27.41 TRINITY_DN16413_c0_g1_i1:62-409(+)